MLCVVIRMKHVWYNPSGQYKLNYMDMLEQPHLLIAGATGSGKSVVINGLMYTALYGFPTDSDPKGKQFIFLDPKRVELVAYRDLPHTLMYASEPQEMISALDYALKLCDWRYQEMQRQGVRKWLGGDIYVVIDEFADLMTTNKREVMPRIQRLAQIGRASKIHIILATQTPIAKVLPTEIKCNFDSRLGLRTRSAQDSRNITGKSGCETFPRYGLGYYMTPEREETIPLTMYSDAELRDRIDWWMQQKKHLRRPFRRRH